MGKYSHERPPRHMTVTAALLALTALLALALAGVLLWRASRFPGSGSAQAAGTDASVTEPPTEAPTEPSFTPAATGDASQPQYKASYTAPYSEAAAQAVVATAREAELTGALLQILYLDRVNACRAAGEAPMPDFSQPLEDQICPLAEGLSWQQYFLGQALTSWHAQQAALYAAAQPQKITEEAYQPDLTDNLHEKYIAPDLPVNDFLYQDQPCYKPNSVHQAYLDSLGELLNEQAGQLGFSDLEELAKESANASADAWLQAATDYNLAYMYFTEAGYGFDPDDGAVLDHLRSGEADTAAGAEETVDIRQILVVPQGAQIAADGTVTAAPEQWEAARQETEELVSRWQSGGIRSLEAEFAQLASEESDDEGSKINGGYYYSVRKGQLIQPLDEWCFANGRQRLDWTVLRTELGYHIVLLTAVRESALENARQELLSELQQEQWEQWRQEVPLEVNDSAIALWADTRTELPTLEQGLYPDVAHERFPQVMVYLQQDYFYYPFGDREIGKNGCGITAWAMLATYMTDSLQTPAMMADRFSEQYFDYAGHSTNGNIFSYAPAEMGFYLDKMAFDLDEVTEALENGQVLISRQQKGHFTSTGHFLVVGHREDDDTFQVRDSNIYNYGNKAGHRIDGFTRSDLLSGGGLFYIMQRKVTAIPACARCGGSFETHQPEKLMQSDYLCKKCAAALSRRGRFLSILNGFPAEGV